MLIIPGAQKGIITMSIVARFLYQRSLRPILFRMDPELVHDRFVDLGELLGKSSLGRASVSIAYGVRGDASVTVDGLRYSSPIVLAAGFDYNARLLRILKSVGFGGVEIGSVTARPCAGNPPPRMRRLVRSRSLVVYKGLRNDGVETITRRILATPRQDGFVVGVSIARTNDEIAATLAGGIDDYRTSLAYLVEQNAGDFYTLNISCPNVHGGESFGEPARLTELLSALSDIRHDRPVYIKMPIDLRWDDFSELMDVIDRFDIRGVVIGNLNKDYRELAVPAEAPAEYRGGLSGAPCFARSTRLIRATRERYGDRFTIMGCGGIMSPDDAMEKFDAGSDLLQLISGMIFEGPHLMREISRAYVERTARIAPFRRAEGGVGAPPVAR
jgi:dihydroorotate dehydrogenase